MLLRKIGMFFLIMGLLFLLVTISSGNLNSQSLTLFCIGVPLVLFGGTLWYRNREVTPSQRFRTLRKFSTKENIEEDEDE